jgi:hypothetical protein
VVPLVPLREFVQRMKNNEKTKAINPRACTTDLEPKNYEMLNAMIMARINDSGKQSISYYPEINRTLRSGEAPGQGKTATKGAALEGSTSSGLQSGAGVTPLSASATDLGKAGKPQLPSELQESLDWVDTLKNWAPTRGYFPIFEFKQYHDQLR